MKWGAGLSPLDPGSLMYWSKFWVGRWHGRTSPSFQFEGTRNATELRKYWQNSEHPSISKEEWSEEETSQLQEIAARHSLVDWQAIAQELGVKPQRSPEPWCGWGFWRHEALGKHKHLYLKAWPFFVAKEAPNV